MGESEPRVDDALRALLAPLAEVPPMPAASRSRVRERLDELRDVPGVERPAAERASGASGTGGAGGSAPTIARSLAVRLSVAGTLGGLVLGALLGWGAASSLRTAVPSSPESTAHTMVPAAAVPADPASETNGPLETESELPPEPLAPSNSTVPAVQEERSAADRPSRRIGARRTVSAPELREEQAPEGLADPGSTLEAERRLIDGAFAALGRGNVDEALSALDRHRARYPEGILAREREALSARAIRLQGELLP